MWSEMIQWRNDYETVTIIEVRHKNPDATYVSDKRNNDLVLKRMQETVKNYKPQQEARPMASYTVQKNLLGNFMRSDADESLQRNLEQQPPSQARSTSHLQTPKCEKDPSSPQLIPCRTRDLVSDYKQKKSTKSMGVRITWQNDSTTAKKSWRMQNLVPDDIQQLPSAREAESRNALQHVEMTQRIQRLGHADTQQRLLAFRAVFASSTLGDGCSGQPAPTISNVGTSWRPGASPSLSIAPDTPAEGPRGAGCSPDRAGEAANLLASYSQSVVSRRQPDLA